MNPTDIVWSPWVWCTHPNCQCKARQIDKQKEGTWLVVFTDEEEARSGRLMAMTASTK